MDNPFLPEKPICAANWESLSFGVSLWNQSPSRSKWLPKIRRQNIRQSMIPYRNPLTQI